MAVSALLRHSVSLWLSDRRSATASFGLAGSGRFCRMAESVFVEVDCSGADVVWWVRWFDGTEVIRRRVPGVSGPVVELAALASVEASIRLEVGERLDRLHARRLAEGRLVDALSDGLWHRIDDVLDVMAGPFRVREADRRLVHRLAGRGVVRQRTTGVVAWFAAALPAPPVEVLEGETVSVVVPTVRARSLPRAEDAREWSTFKAKEKKVVADQVEAGEKWDEAARAAAKRMLTGHCRIQDVVAKMSEVRRPRRSEDEKSDDREKDAAWLDDQIEAGDITQSQLSGMIRKAPRKRPVAGG